MSVPWYSISCVACMLKLSSTLVKGQMNKWSETANKSKTSHLSAILNPDETADRHGRGKVQSRSQGFVRSPGPSCSKPEKTMSKARSSNPGLT